MRRLFWMLICFCPILALAADEARTWTDTQGRKMQAQFVREVDGDVTFLKDGKLITLPLEKLSEEDQKFIRDAELNKKVEETAPPAGAPRPVETSSLPLDSPSASETKSSLTKQKIVAEERTWRDLRGKPQVGKFVRMHQGFVIISSGARAIRLPFNGLSQPDREYLRQLLAARGESAQLPPDRTAAPAVAQDAAPAEATPATEPVPDPVAVAPPPISSAPTASPTAPQGDQGAGRSAPGASIASNTNDQLARMQDRNQKQLDAMHERNQQNIKRNQELAQQSLERLKPKLAPQQPESPQDLVGSCSNCKKTITREQSSSMKCPHCGVIWEYEIDEFGRKKEIPGAKEAIASSGGQTRTGWEFEDRHYRKLFTRIIIPIVVIIFTAIGAAIRGRR